MKKLIVLIVSITLFHTCICMAQSEEFNLLLSCYAKNNIKYPVNITSIDTTNAVLLDKIMMNKLLFDRQKKRAKFYAPNGKLFRVPTYGRIRTDSFVYRTWKEENGETVWYTASFETKAHALWHLDIDKNYHAWLTRVVGVGVTYIDLYVFDKAGKLMSLLNLYEDEHESWGQPSRIANVYITSSIMEDGTVLRKEDRLGVKTTRKLKLQPDGYFRIVQEKITLAAYITDPDGYTNVRKSPNSDSPILYKIYDDELFFIESEPVNDNWCKISSYTKYDKNGNVSVSYENGYIHKSRVEISLDY